MFENDTPQIIDLHHRSKLIVINDLCMRRETEGKEIDVSKHAQFLWN